MKRIREWFMRDAEWWQFWHPGSGISGGAVIGVIFAVIVLTLAGCTVVPATTARQACDLLSIAMDEAQMAGAWYIEAGKILEACGARDATERAEYKACYARRFNDDSVVCE